jgi:hypothetical protein
LPEKIFFLMDKSFFNVLNFAPALKSDRGRVNAKEEE